MLILCRVQLSTRMTKSLSTSVRHSLRIMESPHEVAVLSQLSKFLPTASSLSYDERNQNWLKKVQLMLG